MDPIPNELKARRERAERDYILSKALRPLNLSVEMFEILYAHRRGPLNRQDIRLHMSAPLGASTRTALKLEGKGLLISRLEGRENISQLTEKGRTTLDDAINRLLEALKPH